MRYLRLAQLFFRVTLNVLAKAKADLDREEQEANAAIKAAEDRWDAAVLAREQTMRMQNKLKEILGEN